MVRRRKTHVASEDHENDGEGVQLAETDSSKETPEFLKAYLREQAERDSDLKAKEAEAAKKEAEKRAAAESQQLGVVFIFMRVVLPSDFFSAPRAW
eukprot:CAMPEP_0172163340 /NCGR_PEP_ID=MMETSP1050-20130122/7218_1 /TAXON_ID=233186 /ORGANISM="Cryptomonas curvata, Strain CCAP979/52" /LENGTH=95 /DNA_ID=CAMNT_0012833521 /DNA_START=38 /DNA_END=322 /DNA_ORIENTATION=+